MEKNHSLKEYILRIRIALKRPHFQYFQSGRSPFPGDDRGDDTTLCDLGDPDHCSSTKFFRSRLPLHIILSGEAEGDAVKLRSRSVRCTLLFITPCAISIRPFISLTRFRARKPRTQLCSITTCRFASSSPRSRSNVKLFLISRPRHHFWISITAARLTKTISPTVKYISPSLRESRTNSRKLRGLPYTRCL